MVKGSPYRLQGCDKYSNDAKVGGTGVAVLAMMGWELQMDVQDTNICLEMCRIVKYFLLNHLYINYGYDNILVGAARRSGYASTSSVPHIDRPYGSSPAVCFLLCLMFVEESIGSFRDALSMFLLFG